jgi:histidyl-tRNA synthetase
MAAEGEEVLPPAPAQLLVVPDGGRLAVAASAVARAAREVVPTMVDYSDRSLKAKMRTANRLGVRWVALFNSEEADRQVVQLKEMAGGEQVEVGWTELPEKLR